MKQLIAVVLLVPLPSFLFAHDGCQETPRHPEGRPTLISFVEPGYPDEACTKGYEGRVSLAYTIQKDGTISDIKVLGADPADVFEQSAMAALAQMKYEPVEESCRALGVTYEFRLERCEDRDPKAIVIADLPQEVPAIANLREDELRTYTVSITSSSRDEEVPIQGSIAYGVDGAGYVQISGFTPYEIAIQGPHLIAIVHAPRMRVDVVVKVNGEPIMEDEDVQLGWYGDNYPRPGMEFAGGY